ncbi:kinase domain protein (macronuclear) [Tetrahymena thermophila SB210]|uniref:Kinase domain protein n=1 Tax=Tetrahymena thermophila (strain SB210) TaxID=312017 RepID=I7MKC8_TETTS|nr:kinase domain protein [Tetrahymena thermophila SB210]EAR98182.1 kinase domain protein [Tetrahymena thermophila SB210]|eukprot:XP_001018427.1 kinase domain protein [Tetrahymena thermophila SB210]
MSLLELYNQNPFQQAKVCPQQKEISLNLSKKQIDDKGIKILLSNMKSLKQLTTIQLLLNNNNIGDKGISDLVNWLNTQQNLVNLSLFISFNSFTKKGIKCLSEIKQIKSLEKLSLAVSKNELGQDLAQSLGQFIAKQINVKQLVVIVNECDLGNFGAISICQSTNFLTQLEKLEIFLDGNSMTDQGALNSAKIISKNKQLKYLHLEVCRFKIKDFNYEGLIYDLRSNVISQSCAKEIIQTIGTQMPQLETLNLKALFYSDFSFSQFRKEGYDGLAKDELFTKEDVYNYIEKYLQYLQSKTIVC